MERYVQRSNRQQIILAPICLDDMIAQDNPVRAIEAIVERMDIPSLGFVYAKTRKIGRKPYNPVDMFKLYAYGYLNGLRSSRKLERECTRNIELWWLLGELRPHYKTIANFRRENKTAMVRAFRRFSLICDELGLIGKEMVAIDGSKFRANNGRGAWYNKKKLERQLAYYRTSAEKYLQLLDSCDQVETDDDDNKRTSDEYCKKLEHILSRIDGLEKMGQQIANTGEASISDPDGRLMKLSNGGCGVCHNVQIAVDSKYHLVVAVDVVNEPGDKQQLANMALQSKTELEVKELTVVADAGYYTASEFAVCMEHGITPLVSKPVNRKSAVNTLYSKMKFHYDKNQDAYICPQGQVLCAKARRQSSKTPGTRYNNPAACLKCKVKAQCTAGKYRNIYDRPFQRFADQVDYNTKIHMPLYKKRQELVEHPFGTVKSGWGYGQFLTKGSENVRTESLMHFFAYNLRRVINIVGVSSLTNILPG